MPLAYANIGENYSIKKVSGNPETKQFLSKLGVIQGGNVTLVNATGGNVIVGMLESRIAISRKMAMHIFV